MTSVADLKALVGDAWSPVGMQAFAAAVVAYLEEREPVVVEPVPEPNPVPEPDPEPEPDADSETEPVPVAASRRRGRGEAA